jgi:hypothetical protein
VSSILGIALALVLLMALAYRGVSVLLLAPLMALLAAALSPNTPLLASYTQVFMPALGGFVIAFFPLFLLGAVFGKLMEDSGAALVIAEAITRALGSQRAILAIVLACAVLTYGGVSLFVVAFAVYPIAAALFRQADIPKRLLPATIALGAFTFTMTALPGTPTIQNAIPMPFFGTTDQARLGPDRWCRHAGVGGAGAEPRQFRRAAARVAQPRPQRAGRPPLAARFHRRPGRSARLTWPAASSQQLAANAKRLAAIDQSVGAMAAVLVASRRPGLAAAVSVSAFAHPEQTMRRWLFGVRVPHWPLGWGIDR